MKKTDIEEKIRRMYTKVYHRKPLLVHVHLPINQEIGPSTYAEFTVVERVLGKWLKLDNDWIGARFFDNLWNPTFEEVVLDKRTKEAA